MYPILKGSHSLGTGTRNKICTRLLYTTHGPSRVWHPCPRSCPWPRRSSDKRQRRRRHRRLRKAAPLDGLGVIWTLPSLVRCPGSSGTPGSSGFVNRVKNWVFFAALLCFCFCFCLLFKAKSWAGAGRSGRPLFYQLFLDGGRRVSILQEEEEEESAYFHLASLSLDHCSPP